MQCVGRCFAVCKFCRNVGYRQSVAEMEIDGQNAKEQDDEKADENFIEKSCEDLAGKVSTVTLSFDFQIFSWMCVCDCE